MKISGILPILLISSIFFFSSCNSSSTGVEDTPPDLPPSAVLDSDFSLFTENDPGTGNQFQEVVTDNPYSHFLNASARAAILNGTINANLLLPASILAAAQNVEPVINEDDQWEWTYSVSGNSETFAVSLVGEEQNNDQITWNVFISNSLLNLDNELLFEGVSSSGSRTGSWTVYQLTGFGISAPLIQVDWSFNNLSQYSRELEFLQIQGFPPIKSISAEKDDSEKRTVTRDENDDLRSEIVWNTESREGAITAPGYNSGNRSCWDSSFRNIECD
jgi:hypothetical protein